MSRAASLLLVALATAACSRSRDDHGGLPPATDWQAPPPLASGGPDQRAGATGGDPHAGLDLADGSAGGAGGDPHAGLDLGDQGGADPHAGLDLGDQGGAAADLAALPPPDPDRPIDPSKFLRGQIVATAEVAGLVRPGAILFLSVKPIDPTTGDVIGGTIAAERLDIGALPTAFSLTEANSMVGGTRFAGDVIVTARIDGDGEARSAQPGDVEGSVKSRIPSDGLTIALDRVVR